MRYRIIDGQLVKTPAEDEAAAAPRTFSRRRFLEASFFTIGAATLAACGNRNCDPATQNCSSSGGGGFVSGGG